MTGTEPGRMAIKVAAALLTVCAASVAVAAGGHHAVDDAAIMEEGACKVETWASRFDGGDRLLHLGSGCRIGPFELGASAEPARAAGSSETSWGLQAKWATELAPGFSAGLSVAPAWQAHVRPRYQGTAITTLWTWAAREDLSLHLNLGRQFANDGPNTKRGGVAAEWTAAPGWQIVAERFLESETHYFRAGARWAFADGWSVDFSRAKRLASEGASFWTIGATWQFQRH